MLQYIIEITNVNIPIIRKYIMNVANKIDLPLDYV